MVVIGETYTFEELERKVESSQYLIVLNIAFNMTAIYHTFSENFSKEYQSGDGVLLYKDGEAHSSSSGECFKVISEIKL